MAEVQEIVTYKGSIEVKIDRADLTESPVGYPRRTYEHKVPGSGVKCRMIWYSGGRRSADKNHISVYLKTDKPVKATMTFAVSRSVKHTKTCFLSPETAEGFPRFASHKQLLPQFRHDKLTIRCSVKFFIPTKRRLSIPRNFQLFRHVATDVELVIGDSVVPAHRGFLSLISPVFHAMLAENQSNNEIHITDHDVETVRSAVEYCYGQRMGALSAETAVSVLRFCNRFQIDAVVEELEKLTVLIPSTKNFCQVVQYAYDCSRDELISSCCDFLKAHHDEIKVLPEIADLPPTRVVDIVKKTFGLETDYDVLNHAQTHEIDFVVDHLEEQLFINALSADNFVLAVVFAWKWDRETLQHACGQFLNDNREVTKLKDFANLPSEVLKGVLEASNNL